ncbi:MAG: RNA polymerase factor sigma-32 [Alphaproteobacteria bacterium]|nr:MAG: RNA polymerase factor sigma-32 [Alphaproteobacteria bacterium]
MDLSKFKRPITPLSGEDSLSHYIRSVNKFPLLTPHEEEVLVKMWVENGNIEAAQALINTHLRLAIKIAGGYSGYNFVMAELISEATVGLSLAVRNFDAAQGARFSTYATWWIHAQLKQYALHNWSLVKVGTTRAQKKLFFTLRRLKAKIQGEDSQTLSSSQCQSIASELGVTTQEVANMEQRLGGRDFSLQTPLSSGGDGDESTFEDITEDNALNPEEYVIATNEHTYRLNLAKSFLSQLSARERAIIMHRICQEKPKTLEVLSQKFGISRERIRQIESVALRKVRSFAQGLPN